VRPELARGRLAPGDRLLLFTDGVLEARDPQRQFVDLQQLVQPLRTGPLDLALDAVLAELRQAVGGDLGDDLAMLVAEWAPRAD
jgi:serine phosphatase RsbU (regulator of sigma subunit)